MGKVKSFSYVVLQEAPGTIEYHARSSQIQSICRFIIVLSTKSDVSLLYGDNYICRSIWTSTGISISSNKKGVDHSVHASLSHLKGTDSNNCKLGSQSSAGKLLDGILHYSLSKEQRLLPTRSLADRIYARSDLTPHHLLAC